MPANGHFAAGERPRAPAIPYLADEGVCRTR